MSSGLDTLHLPIGMSWSWSVFVYVGPVMDEFSVQAILLSSAQNQLGWAPAPLIVKKIGE